MKQYQGEKAIISLTSWKNRIGTVARTVFSLLQQCPGFHIVLVLCTEEFPNESCLPDDLKILIERNIIEVLWVAKNYRAFKKILFTMHKYKDVPIISADDGCIYIRNYAQELYNKWLENKNCIISEYHQVVDGIPWGGGGHGTLFPPNCFEGALQYLEDPKIIECNHDDAFYGVLAKKRNIPYIFLTRLHAQPRTMKEVDERNGLCRNRKFKDSVYKEYLKRIAYQ